MIPDRLLLPYLWLTLFLVVLPQFVQGVDHNNIDSGRPLSFDDAEAVALRERSIEVGLGGISPYGSSAGMTLDAGFLYGFALNSHLMLDADAVAGGRAGSLDKGFQIEGIKFGIFHNFNREFGNTPAFSVLTGLDLPTEDGSNGVAIHFRGIASKVLFQYDRIHLNLDGIVKTDAENFERGFLPRLILGYSKPLGYPRSFFRTGVAELSMRSTELKGTGPVMSFGIGLRQQVTVRSVIDIGISSDFWAIDQAPHEDFKLIAGYSVSF